MAIIKSSGLFGGDRLKKCSKMARLYWHMYFVASNRMGRLELNYEKINDDCFKGFPGAPTQAEFLKFIREYFKHYLLFVYKSPDGRWWGQWEIPDECKERFPTAQCKRSPEPDAKLLAKWRQEYQEIKDVTLLEISALFPEVSKSYEDLRNPTQENELVEVHSHGIGIGTGEGIGVGRELEESRAIASQPTVAHPTAFLLPLNSGKEYAVTQEFLEEMKRAYPAVDVFFQLNKMRAWLVSTTNKKTIKGIKRFINNWLSKEQDKGGGCGQNQPTRPNGGSGSSRAEQRAERINGTAEEAVASILGTASPARPLLPSGSGRGAAGYGHKNLIGISGGRGEKSD